MGLTGGEASRAGERTVLVGVTGGIAIYKAVELVRLLVKDGLHAARRRAPRPPSGSSCRSRSRPSRRRRCSTTRAPGRPSGGWFQHIEAARRARVMVVAPATANTVAKMAAGMADNLLTAIYLAFRGPVIVAPTMNWAMYEHPATVANLRVLAGARRRGAARRARASWPAAKRAPGAWPRPTRSGRRPARLRRRGRRAARRPQGRRHRRRHARAHRRGALHRQPLERQDGPRGGRRGLSARRRRRRSSRREPARRRALPPRRGRERRRHGRRPWRARSADADVLVMAAAVADFARREAQDGKIDARRAATR